MREKMDLVIHSVLKVKTRSPFLQKNSLPLCGNKPRPHLRQVIHKTMLVLLKI